MAELVAKAQMLIRRPAAEIFRAFVEPDLITKFWLESTTGPLSPDAQVEWRFLVPGASERVRVTAFEDPQRISFAWSAGALAVDIHLLDEQKDVTVVSVEARGFQGEDKTDQVVGATEGFSIVLSDLKVFLESGRSPGLVKDKAALINSSHSAERM